MYDSLGNLAVSVENDFVEILESRLDAFVLNSEKYICIPLDEEFKIEIVSTDDGEMNYYVFEFDENSEMTREVSKENIVLTEGESFECVIDNIINTDIDNYNLVVTNTQEIIAMDKEIDCVPATGISISQSSLELKPGQSLTLFASLSPANTTDEFTWISSDEFVVTVSDDGVVKAINEGEATVIVLISDLIYAECKVIVGKKDCILSWIVDGVITQQSTTPGSIIIKPDNPTKPGYVFKEWITEIPDTMPDYNLTFTAVFEE